MHSILNKHKIIFCLIFIKPRFVEFFYSLYHFLKYWKNDPKNLWPPFCNVYQVFMMYKYGQFYNFYGTTLQELNYRIKVSFKDDVEVEGT